MTLFVLGPGGSWVMPVPVAAHAVFGGADVFLAATLNIVLLYFIATRLRAGRWLATLGVVTLTLTPANAAIGVDSRDVFVIPFVLAWLLGLLVFFDRRQTLALAGAMLALGIGFYTQPAAPLTTIAFAALTLVALSVHGEQSRRTYVVAVAAFIAPLLVMIPWFIAHPETYPDTIGAWLIHKAHILNPLDGLRATVNWNMLGTRLSTYWELFNPIALLLGTLLTPLAVLIPVGLINAASQLDPARRLLLFGGLLLAPVAAASFGLPDAASRALTMIPFLVLFGSLGLCWILNLDGVRR